MSLIAFKANNHPQQVRYRRALDVVDDRATTPDVFSEFDARFNFTLDVAAAAHNAKCSRFYSKTDDGLVQPWDGRVWCNPPYSSIELWLIKAWQEWRDGRAELIVFLLPANRTEQGFWQRQIEPFRRRDELQIEFLAGRMRFIRFGAAKVGPNERPPFGVCLVIWDRQRRRDSAPC